MKKKLCLSPALLCLSLMLALAPAWAASPEITYIDPPALKAMLCAPDLVLIDTSTGWWTYKEQIPGSFILPEEASTWGPRLSKDKKIVLYCG